MSKIEEFINQLSEEDKKILETMMDNYFKKEKQEWKVGDKIYYITKCFGVNYRRIDYESSIEIIKEYDYYHTREEAEFEAERRKVLKELDKFTVKEVGAREVLYVFNYNTDRKRIEIHFYCNYAEFLIFPTRRVAESAIKAVGEERLKKYYFRIKED